MIWCNYTQSHINNLKTQILYPKEYKNMKIKNKSLYYYIKYINFKKQDNGNKKFRKKNNLTPFYKMFLLQVK